jgi:hypothetical protein
MVDAATRCYYDDEPQWTEDVGGGRRPKTFEECYGCSPVEHEEGAIMRKALVAALAVSPGCRGAELVPASVLEERDRELEVERRRSNGVASHAGHWAKCARESALEAAQLRSQLTEARAALQELVTLKDGPRDAQYELRKPKAWEAAREFLRMSGLVPAPQDREPA